MSLAQLIQYCISHSISLSVVKGDLRINAVPGAVTKEILQHLKQNKAELIHWLQQKQLPAAITVREQSGAIPLSFGQQRLWFIDQLEGGSAHYNMPLAFTVSGPFNVSVAEQALQEIVNRHEVLRTHYRSGEQGPEQIIQASSAINLSVVDLTHLSGEDQQAEIQRLATQDAVTPFNLSSDVMLRASWLKVGLKLENAQGVLLFNMHHIASDGWSMGILFKEFVHQYRVISLGKSEPLAPLPIQYADYALWQRDYLQGEILDKQLAYWAKQLSDAPAIHQLPLDFQRAQQAWHQGDRIVGLLPARQATRFNQLALQQGVTPFILIHAAFSLLLSRHSHNPDIIIGTPVANRLQKEVEPLIGYFSNTLVLRSHLQGCETFLEYLAHVKQTNLDAQAHQDIPFEQLVEYLKIPRNSEHSPLCQIMLSMNNNEQQSLELAGLSFTPMQNTVIQAKFDLQLDAKISEQGLSLGWTYDMDLFKRSSIERFNLHLQRLIAGILDNPHSKLSELPMLSEEEIYTLVHEKNNTWTDYPKHKLIHQLFEEQAEKVPDNIALVFEDQQLTYQQLNHQANQLAHYLREKGVIPETLVGICVERSMDMVTGILAILKAGGAYVPLDPGYPQSRLDYMIEDSGITLLLTQSSVRNQFKQKQLEYVVLDEVQKELSNYTSVSPDSSQQQADSLAYVIYTSGSTGEPKGVLQTHGNVTRLFYVTQSDYEFCADDTWVLFHSISFDFSVWELWGALNYGGKLVIPSFECTRDPTLFLQLCIKQQVSILNQTPSAFKAFSQAAIKDQANLLELRFVIFGGEALQIEELLPWWEQYKVDSPQLVNMYGITETTVHVTLKRLSSNESGSSNIGHRLKDQKIYLLDHHLNLVPDGSTGEIYVGGAGLARGYLNRLDLTNERFVWHSFDGINSERLYKTGDLARYLTNGELEFVGRVDEQVKVRGFRIELGEIEQQLLACEEVSSSLVLTSQDESGQKALVAYVVPHSVKDANYSDLASNLRSQLQELLPDYMLPAAFAFVEQWPLTANGKIDKSALPDPDYGLLQNQYTAPSTEIERRLCEIWQEVLGLELVGVTDNFFSIGGDSIKSLAMVSKSKNAGIYYSVQDLFKSPTIADLANAYNKIQKQILPPIQAFDLLTDSEKQHFKDDPTVADAYPLTMLQQGMVFHNLKEQEKGTYHDVFSFKLNVDWQKASFQQALTHMVNRHEVLRSVFMMNAERPLLIVLSEVKQIPLIVHDLQLEDEEGQSRIVEAWKKKERGLQFDFSMPLWQITIHQLSHDEFYYHFSMHHAILDGWSVASLNTELFSSYKTLLQAKNIEESTSPLFYRYYVNMEQMALNSPAEKNYWLTKLDGAELPWWASSNRGKVNSVSLKIPSQQSQALFSLARRLGVQEKSILLTIHVALMGLISGKQDVLTSIVSHGRPEFEGSDKTLGLFLNSLPLRINLFDLTWEGLIRCVEQELADTFEYRHFPLAEIQKQTKLDFSASLFNFVNFHVYEQVLDDISLVESDSFGETNYAFQSNFSKNLISGEIGLTIKGDSNSFSENFLLKVKQYAINTIDALLSDLNGRIQSEKIIGVEESRYLIDDLNNTRFEYPGDTLLHELFKVQAEKTPDNIALVFNDKQLTYRELNERSNLLASHLRDSGIQSDVLVGLCVERSLEMVVGILAILKAGGAYVPLDPDYPQEMLDYMTTDSQIPLLLTQSHLCARFNLKQYQIIALDQVKDQNPGANKFLEVTNNQNGANLAYVIYTSGSTGKPKGVLVKHSNLLNFNYSFDTQMTLLGGNRAAWLWHHSFAFDASIKGLVALCSGQKVVLTSKEQAKDIDALVGLLTKHNINIFNAPPLLMELMLDVLEALPKPDINILVSGDKVSAGLWQRIVEYTNNHKLKAINAYGPTETTINSSFAVVAGDTPHIGTPIANTQAYVLGSHAQLLPSGCIGELCIGGAGLTNGYLNRPELTRQQFIDIEILGKTQRVYRTGDTVRRLADGKIEFIGRQDDQVKIRGFRVEVGEVEHQLKECKNVISSLVMAIDDASDNKYLMAYVITDNSDVAWCDLEANIRQTLSQKLPDYMIPRTISVLEKWPLTASGKVDKSALPALQDTTVQSEYVEPETDIEKSLQIIWSNLLGLEARKIGATANFFMLGGDSLITIKLLSAISKQFPFANLSISQLIKFPTIQKCAALLECPDNNNTSIPLTELNPVSEITDKGSAIIICPAAGLTGASYLAFARQCVGHRTIVLEPKGVRNNEQPHTEFTEMINESVTALTSLLAPTTHIRLLGHSFGGWAAFDIACELEKAGYLVDLILVESVIRKEFNELFSKESANVRIGKEELRQIINQSKGSEELNELLSEDVAKNLYNVYQRQLTWLEFYQPKQNFCGQITYVYGEQSARLEGALQDVIASIQKYSSSDTPIKVCKVRGDHFSIFSTEFVSELIQAAES